MLTIEVDSTPVEERQFTKKETGEIFTFRNQQAYLHGTGKYPLPFSLSLPEGAAPYEAGKYEIDLSSFEIERGNLRLKRYFTLKPLSGSALKAAS